MSYIKAVLFDLWGTLMAEVPDQSRARSAARMERVAAVLAAAGFPRDTATLDDAFRRFLEAHIELHRQELDVSARGRVEMFVQALDPSLEPRLEPATWSALDEAFFNVAREFPPAVIPGARDVVAAVRKMGLRTALVSNTGITPGFVLRDLIGGMGLLRHLEVLSFSDEVLAAKPSPRIFARTLSELDVPPSLAVFVGDMPVLDVMGPLRAGMWSVQVGGEEMDGIRPHTRIPSVADLLPALAQLGLVPPALAPG